MTDDKNVGRTENLTEENDKAGVNNEEKTAAEETAEEKSSGPEAGTNRPGSENSEKNGENNKEPENEKKGGKEDLLAQKEKEINELKEQFLRLAAEFDNYKKRTKKEKEKIYTSSVADVVSAFLPVVDNIERALKASEGSNESIREGIEMIHRQTMDVLSKLGVEPIEAKGRKFDAKYHEAIMHIEDENYGENEVVEEFLKGYKYNDIVIRHSVVKVAN